MVKNLSCVSCGSLKRFPHTFTTAHPLAASPENTYFPSKSMRSANLNHFFGLFTTYSFTNFTKKAIDTHFTSNMDSADSQNYYWTTFLYCIIGLQPNNDEEYKTYMKILKQILCDEQNYSNNAITLPVST